MKFRWIATAAVLAAIGCASCAEAPAASAPPATTASLDAIVTLAPRLPSASPQALPTGGPPCSAAGIGTLTVCPGLAPIGSAITISGLNCGNPGGPAILYFGSESPGGQTTAPVGSSELGRFPVDSDGRFQATVTLPTVLDPIQGQGGGAVAPGVYAIYSKPELCSARLTVTSGALMAPADAERLVAAPAAAVLGALKSRNGPALAALAHPDKGVRFSPYPYIQLGKDQVLTRGDLAKAFADGTVRLWGITSGRGDEIRLTYADYHDRYVYDQDFRSAPQIAYNQTLARGNTIGNGGAVYPNAIAAEFYFPGFDPKFQGLDWRSLDLVFEPVGQTWYLIAVVHGEWTP